MYHRPRSGSGTGLHEPDRDDHSAVPVAGDVAADNEAAATPPAFTATPPPVSLPAEVAGFRVILDSGQSASASYQVPVGQVLELACQIPGHVAQGMIGTVELQDVEGP